MLSDKQDKRCACCEGAGFTCWEEDSELHLKGCDCCGGSGEYSPVLVLGNKDKLADSLHEQVRKWYGWTPQAVDRITKAMVEAMEKEMQSIAGEGNALWTRREKP